MTPLDQNIEAPTRKVHVESWGCQMNVADSERMLALLGKNQYEQTLQGPEDADLIVLNTCNIREKARHKVVSRLGVLRELKEKNPKLRIAVTGCVAQAEGKKLLKEAPMIDVVLGPGRIDDLPDVLRQLEASKEAQIAIGFTKREPDAEPIVNTPLTGKNEITRYVTIAQGCDNFCTFCIVPHTRGREVSRSKDEIVAECVKQVQGGAREIMLLGQNVNSYGNDLSPQNTETGAAFVELLRAVAAVPGLWRLRFTTSNPHDFTRPLANLFGSEPKLGRYLHLPVQSGSNPVLERMRRKVTVEEYRERIQWLRDIVPDIALSTDLIVGFPGETDEDFAGTLELVREVGYSFIFSFKYSPRQHTAAARFRDQVPEAVKDQRLAALNKLQDAITIEQNLGEIGKQRLVLVQYESKKEAGIYYGRTEQYRLVRIPSKLPISGQLLGVEIVDANKTALAGKLL
jgi:tRNA-2-methylthio-N6-dimethylallyladenosine synthase